MWRNRVSPMGVEERKRLIQVARGERAPTKWIRKARYANLVTGEWEEGEILLYGKRIAYAGKKEPILTEGTEIIDGQDFTLVPGYIEPHAHPFQLYHPLTLADFALRHGTTFLVSDNMVFFHLFALEEVIARMEELTTHPVKFGWWVRLSPQSGERELESKYNLEAIRALAQHPLTYQGGEVTDLQAILRGESDTLEKLQLLTDQGKRIEGHAPGASVETLTAFALAGITSDHEAINGEECLRRLRLGLYCPMRHSSIRRDLPELLRGLKDLRYGWERLMFTTDGSTPPFLRHGLIDALIRIAIEEGMDPLLAYRIASLHPAAYYHIDGEVGMIAPGRLADLNFLREPGNPTPAMVMVEGELDWKEEGIAPRNGLPIATPIGDLSAARPRAFPPDDLTHAKPAVLTPEVLSIPWQEGIPFPVVHFLSDVITVVKERILPVQNGRIDLEEAGKEDEELLYAYLIDKKGRWITKGVVSHFAKGLTALASTYTASQDIVLIGKEPDKLAEAYERVKKAPGILLHGKRDWKHLSLPIGGFLSDQPMEELIEASESLEQALRESGFPHLDPFYALLFISSVHLPKVRFTERGVLSVKDGRLLLPSVPF